MPERRRLWQTLMVATLAVIAIVGLLMMAKEQQMNQEISPFNGRNNLALAQAVARGDTNGIAEQATEARLHEQGDRQVTLLQWAILSQQTQSLSSLRAWMAIARCILPLRCRTRSIFDCCWLTECR